eukprot:6432888-Amphidinium_carterae.1
MGRTCLASGLEERDLQIDSRRENQWLGVSGSQVVVVIACEGGQEQKEEEQCCKTGESQGQARSRR